MTSYIIVKCLNFSFRLRLLDLLFFGFGNKSEIIPGMNLELDFSKILIQIGFLGPLPLIRSIAAFTFDTFGILLKHFSIDFDILFKNFQNF